MKKKAMKVLFRGDRIRKIERVLGISDVTVLYWVRELGGKLSEQKIGKGKIAILELDEVYTTKRLLVVAWGPKRYWEPMLARLVRKTYCISNSTQMLFLSVIIFAFKDYFGNAF
ncbi:MAG: hypothetical protein LBF23_03245, partial [Endomicrobium sp.]|nr:hypothetical protein [Endomicrobium sp.]